MKLNVLLNCPFYDDFRENLFNVCLSNNLDITLLTIKVVSTFCKILQKGHKLRSQKVLLKKNQILDTFMT
jgi:hypothetical protein